MKTKFRLTTRNRGKQSNDDKYFAQKWHPIFEEAVNDLCYLLTRGYALNSGLQIASNSGRLKTKLLEINEKNQYNWEVELVFDPDKVLVKSENIVVSSDGWILDNAQKWFNLGAFIFENQLKDSNIIVI